MPQFGVFVYSPFPADPMALSDEHAKLLEEYPSQVAELGGRIVTGFAFESATSARKVDSSGISDGSVSTGPLVVAGYYVLESADAETAVQIAALNPAVRDGAVEVRPLFVPPE